MMERKRRRDAEKRKAAIERWWRWKRRVRERLRQLRLLAALAILLQLLDSAKIWGATIGNQIVANLSRPRPDNVRNASPAATAEAPPKYEYTPTRQPRHQLYFGRYFERKPNLTLAIRYLELPKNEQVFQYILKQLPEETHAWAHAMFAETGVREFKVALRNHTASETEAIENMKLAARRWQWQRDEAEREKKLELRKKFNRDKEPDDAEYNPRM